MYVLVENEDILLRPTLIDIGNNFTLYNDDCFEAAVEEAEKEDLGVNIVHIKDDGTINFSVIPCVPEFDLGDTKEGIAV